MLGEVEFGRLEVVLVCRKLVFVCSGAFSRSKTAVPSSVLKVHTVCSTLGGMLLIIQRRNLECEFLFPRSLMSVSFNSLFLD
jgi:hypothetical protein